MTTKELHLPRRAAALPGGPRRALNALLARRDRRAASRAERATALRQRLDRLEAARTAAERARLWW